MGNKLSHFDDNSGQAKMVDVGAKPSTKRIAEASAQVTISRELAEILREKRLEKGDAFSVAKTAGILAAKNTQHLIPLCHSLPLDSVQVDITLEDSENFIRIKTKASTFSKTGVEMEALTAASIAALTIYDMCKAVDKTMIISNLGLVNKSGGKSGTFENPFFK